MGFLHRNGHVKATSYKLNSDDTFTTSWTDVGRNLATTFAGFCSAHDAAIFKPIDTKIFDESDAEQLFLFAYRSVVRELHASMEAAMRLQTGYQGRIEEGLDSGSQPEEAGMRALDQMLVAYSTYNYKTLLDDALANSHFQSLQHKVLTLKNQSPSVAVSACFDLANRQNQEDPPRISLNLFPLSIQETVAIYSFTQEDARAAEEYLLPIFSTEADHQKYLISRMVLMHAENFVISPALFDSWSEAKKNKILDFFIKTLRFDSSDESEHLYLF